MLMISREAIESIIATKQKLTNREKKVDCIADIEKMIEIKQSHIWRADGFSPCCGNVCGLVPLFEAEIGILQDALNAIKESDGDKAAALLEDYLAFLEENYESEIPSTNSLELGNN